MPSFAIPFPQMTNLTGACSTHSRHFCTLLLVLAIEYLWWEA